ncbi:putative rRNA processing/ribosome biogenesis [Elsinoe fawcettii]|nr:putative rRNA processing/ribosome biogenesis [Elsinoe fawcettii]
MVQARDVAGVPLLRALSVRLSSVKVPQLPHIVASQVQSIKDCSDLLSQPRNNSQAAGEAGIVVHRFYTQIAALLQGRSAEERWAAAVLIKATVEAGGYESLSRSKHWVSGLLSNLRKPDPPSTRAIVVTTLTRIFMLTGSYPSLIRDITTPSLSPFIKTCISNVTTGQRDERELRVVLESFTQLVSHHHTTFRSHVKDITSMLATEEGQSAARIGTPAKQIHSSTRTAMSRLAVALHQCEPKQGYAASFEESMKALVSNTHRFADVVFFGVDEDLESENTAAKAETLKDLRKQATDRRISAVYANAQHLNYNLEKLSYQVASDSSGAVSVQVQQLNALIQRLTAIVNSPSENGPNIRFSADVTRDERDACLHVLPEVHVTALQLLDTLLSRYSISVAQLAQAWISPLRWLFQCEKAQSDVRSACYILTQRFVNLVGPSLGKETIDQLSLIITAACADLLLGPEGDKHKATNGNGTSNLDGLLKRSPKDQKRESNYPGLQYAASRLLTTAYKQLPVDFVSNDLRIGMDRTVILAQQVESLTAGALNPGQKQDGSISASLLPFLARSSTSNPTIDALLQPRMPVLQSGEVNMPLVSHTAVLSEQQYESKEHHDVGQNQDIPTLADDVSHDRVLIAQARRAELPVAVTETSSSLESRKRHANEDVDKNNIPDKRKRSRTESSVDVPAKSTSLDNSAQLDRLVQDSLAAEESEIVAMDGSAETTASAMAPDPVQGGSAVGSASQVVVSTTVAAESDDEDFEVPDLDMDMSDDEEDA